MGQTLTVRKAAGALGSYIEGVGLEDLLSSDGLFAQVKSIALEREVIFMRDQHVAPLHFQTFAQQFGPVLEHPAYGTVPEAPDVQVLESTPENPSKIEVWHSDMTFSATPPTYTILHGQIIPEYGGDTLWASAVAAYEGLSEHMRALMDELVAVHDFRHGFKESLAEPGGEERLADAIAQKPPVEHPLVRNHPENGKKALEIIRGERPQLVFLDVMMPEMNGMEVCQTVKSDDELKDTHIIILTAKGQEMDKKQGESVGANEYMTKPFNPKQIFALAMEILEIEE